MVLNRILFAVVLLGVANSAATAQSLVVHYSLDGHALDSSGNGHHGSISGATATPDRFNNPSSALRFDGNDSVAVADDPNLVFGADAITMMAWVRMSQLSSDGGYYMMGQSNGGGNNSKWIFFLGNTGLSLVMYPTGGSHWFGCGSFPFAANDWYHVAIRKEGSQVTGFVNGFPVGSNPNAPTSFGDPSTPMYLGTAEGGHPGRVLRGDLDDVRIYRSALTDQEIENIYGSSLGNDYCGPANVNSSGSPAIIGATGTDVVVDNDFTLIASRLPINTTGYFIASRNQGLVLGAGGSQGNLCLGGSIGRFVGAGQVLNSGSVGTFYLAADLTAMPTPVSLVTVQPGETWNFQAWYRDANPAPTSNFTDAVSVVFH